MVRRHQAGLPVRLARTLRRRESGPASVDNLTPRQSLPEFRRPAVARKITLDFLKTEAASGMVLGLAALAALLVANSPLAPA